MTGTENFVYDSEGNLTFDKSKEFEISYDWRGSPIKFIQEFGQILYNNKVELTDDIKSTFRDACYKEFGYGRDDE